MANIQIPQEWIRNLSKQDQITELNSEVKCVLRPSPIHGIGVFALRHIPKGQRCYITPNVIPRFYNIPYASLNGLLPEIKEIILQRWASVVNHSLFQSPNSDAHLLMFVNHSYEPNYDVVSDTALKDVREGEEVTENYCAMKNAELVYPFLDCKNNVIIKKTKPWFLRWLK